MWKVEALSGERLRAELGDDVVIGREILVRSETTSTNDLVWKFAQAGAVEGLVIFAENQTAGRGQRGHSWESAPGKGLWFSFLLFPALPVAHSAKVTQWAATRIARTIEKQFSLPATIKPPNDVYLLDRKLAGVLVEMRARPLAPHLAIVGIGLNVNQTASDFSDSLGTRAISLALAQNAPVDRHRLAVRLLRDLDWSYRRGELAA